MQVDANFGHAEEKEARLLVPLVHLHMVATRNLHSTQDDDLDVDQTAQSIQDQLQQYKLTTFDATRFAGFTNDNDSVLNHVQKGYQQAADIAIDLEQLGESEEVLLVRRII